MQVQSILIVPQKLATTEAALTPFLTDVKANLLDDYQTRRGRKVTKIKVTQDKSKATENTSYPHWVLTATGEAERV